MKFALTTLLLIAGADMLSAAPKPCPASGTLQDLLNLNADGGCTITADGNHVLVFSDFVYVSGLGPGAVRVPASVVTFTTIADGTSPVPLMCPGYGLMFDLQMVPQKANELESTLLRYTFTPPDAYWGTTPFNAIDWTLGPGAVSVAQQIFEVRGSPFGISAKIINITATAFNGAVNSNNAYVHQVISLFNDGIHLNQGLCKAL